MTVPLALRTARAIDLAIGERTEGPLFMARDGRRLHRHGAGRIVRMTARRAGIANRRRLPRRRRTVAREDWEPCRLTVTAAGGSSQPSVTNRNIKPEREPPFGAFRAHVVRADWGSEGLICALR